MRQLKLVMVGAVVAIAACAASTQALAAKSSTAAAASPSPSPLLRREMGVLTRQGISSARASQAIDVQSEVARTDLVAKVEAAMGSAFAGVWFEPATARLHIGVTSPASRRVAEEVVAQAALAADVTLTPVRSTWSQLLAAQSRWDGRLASLFAREEVQTALAPQFNAVLVTLSPSVPSSERVELEREASIDEVRVSITANPNTHPNFMQGGPTLCRAFIKFVANCDKTITSGVRIDEKAGIPCTAGPLAIGKGAEKTKTYVITAGHCVEGTVNEPWFAFKRNQEKGEIGKGKEFSNGEPGDYGDILIETNFWMEPGNNPVFAYVAEWGAAEPLKSYPVKGERRPVVGNTNCHEGQTTGQSCGEIKALNVQVKFFAGPTVNGLVEDKGAIGEGGDSGGPWLFIEKNNEVLMEGSHVGILAQGNLVYEPLETSLPALNLELLTTANEVRRGPYWHVNGALFKAGTKQLNLQLKGAAVLKSKIVSIAVTITCKSGASEGATIEGNGVAQGQDKGTIKLSECKLEGVPKCAIAEPIKTVNTVSHLVTFAGIQSKYADLFEPQQGTTLATIKIVNGAEKCAIAGEIPVKGSLVAEVVPKEAESQEGLLNFPETPITKVSLEGIEKTTGVLLGVENAKLSSAFGAKLVTGERWGVFGS